MKLKEIKIVLIVLMGWLFVNPQQIVAKELQGYQRPTQQKKRSVAPKSVDGKSVYQKFCLTCHQIDGSGVPFTFPSLQKSDWVNGDKTRLINVVLNGLEGDITVNEEPFNNVMPKQDVLTDQQIAAVLSFLRQNFGNASSAITSEEVKKLRKK